MFTPGPDEDKRVCPVVQTDLGAFRSIFSQEDVFLAVILTFSMAVNNLCTFKAFKRFASNANIYWLATIVISQCPFASISKIYWLQKFKEMPFVRPCTQSIMGAGAGSKRKISIRPFGKIIKLLFVAGNTRFYTELMLMLLIIMPECYWQSCLNALKMRIKIFNWVWEKNPYEWVKILLFDQFSHRS